jgi:hypothetical protein
LRREATLDVPLTGAVAGRFARYRIQLRGEEVTVTPQGGQSRRIEGKLGTGPVHFGLAPSSGAFEFMNIYARRL